MLYALLWVMIDCLYKYQCALQEAELSVIIMSLVCHTYTPTEIIILNQLQFSTKTRRTTLPVVVITHAYIILIINDEENYTYLYSCITESVDSIIYICRDEPDSPLTQHITNAGISRARYTITHFKHHHRILRLISNRMSVGQSVSP